jgi:hypothetical protein
LRFGFAADCGDLFIGHGLLAPIADARGGEDLDHVAAFSFSLENHLTQLCRSARLLNDLVNLRQQAWHGDRTGVDGVTHVLGNRRTEASEPS